MCISRCLLNQVFLFAYSGEMRALLLQALLEPRTHRTDALSCGITEVPLKAEQRFLLGTQHGLLSHELYHRPAATLGSLRHLCVSVLERALGDMHNPYVELLLYVVRLATTFEALALATIDEQPAEARDETLRRTLPQLRRLRDDFMQPARELIGHWLVQGDDPTKVQLAVVAHAHLVLLTGNLHRGWECLNELEAKGLRDNWKPLAMAPSAAFVCQWAVGAQHENTSYTNWLWACLADPQLLPNVFATMQEARGELLRSSSDATPELYSWLERTVAVALRRQNGGEVFRPEYTLPTQEWLPIGSMPLLCRKVLCSPGWSEEGGYPPSCDLYYTISFPQAPYITICFDTDTALDTDGDFITFYRDESCTEHWGQRRQLSGAASIGWPGVAGCPPLRIPADSVFIHFHTDASVGERGFMLTAEAPVSEASAVQLVDELRAEGEVDEIADLLAARKALTDSNNVVDHARSFLVANRLELRRSGLAEKTKKERQRVRGVYEDASGQLRVNLQTAEVVLNGQAMVPLPGYIAQT